MPIYLALVLTWLGTFLTREILNNCPKCSSYQLSWPVLPAAGCLALLNNHLNEGGEGGVPILSLQHLGHPVISFVVCLHHLKLNMRIATITVVSALYLRLVKILMFCNPVGTKIQNSRSSILVLVLGTKVCQSSRQLNHLWLVGGDQSLEWVAHHGEGNSWLCQ